MPPPLPAAALNDDDDDDDDDVVRPNRPPAISASHFSASSGSAKFAKELGGLEVGWSASRSNSVADGLVAPGATPELPQQFNRLVSAELGGAHSEAIAERLVAQVGAGAAPVAAPVPSSAPPPPPLLSTAKSVPGAPPPPPMLSGMRASSQVDPQAVRPGPPPQLPSLRNLSTSGQPPPSPPPSPPLPPAAMEEYDEELVRAYDSHALVAAPPAPPPASPPPSPPAFDTGESKGMATMMAAAEAAIAPALDLLWQSLTNDDKGAAGWTAASVVTIAGCLHSHGLRAATESLFAWRDMLSEKKKKELLLPTARALRTIAQSDGFRAAVLHDAMASEHQRLLQLYLGFLREHMNKLADPTAVDTRALCLELMLIVLHVRYASPHISPPPPWPSPTSSPTLLVIVRPSYATTTAVRYDAMRWLKPLYVPEPLRHAWPLDHRAELLESLILWATWREEEAWRAAQEMGAAVKKYQVKKATKAGQKNLLGSEEQVRNLARSHLWSLRLHGLLSPSHCRCGCAGAALLPPRDYRGDCHPPPRPIGEYQR